jgi:hypothetical protein
MMTEQLTLPEPETAAKPPMWRAYQTSRWDRSETVADLLPRVRRWHPGARLDVSKKTWIELTASGANLAGVAPSAHVPDREVWALVEGD